MKRVNSVYNINPESALPRHLLHGIKRGKEWVPRQEYDITLYKGAGGRVKVLLFDKTEHVRVFETVAMKRPDGGPCVAAVAPLTQLIMKIPPAKSDVKASSVVIVDPVYSCVMMFGLDLMTDYVIAHECLHAALKAWWRKNARYQQFGSYNFNDDADEEQIAEWCGKLYNAIKNNYQ